MITEMLINIIGWIIALIILFSPFIIIGAIIYLFKKRKKKRGNRKKEIDSEWTWDENRQLWVHDSEYARQIHVEHTDQTYEQWKEEYLQRARAEERRQNGGNYHYTGNEIPQNITQKPQYPHYENTAKQQSEIKVSIDIPENIQNLINEARKEREAAQANPSQKQADTTNRYKTAVPKPTASQPPKTPVEKPKTTWTPVYQTPTKPEPAKEEKKSEFQNVYKATPILTKNEMNNYKTLQEAAIRKGYIINIKPRLADIITPAMSRKDPRYQANFHRISQKHVDFVVLDMNMKIKAIIELDDSSHDREDRKQRDELVDEILEACGYKIIHTRYIWPDILDNI